MQVAPYVFSPPTLVTPTTAGLREDIEWSAFFSNFQTIVLVANSDDQRLSEILRDPPPKPLYVFFNKIDRVLDTPFPHDCVLVTRCNTAGSEVVYRRRLPGMMRLMPAPFFKGVINLRAASRERLNRPEEFDEIPAGFLDLTEFMESFYPPQHTASSGFAMTAWLKHVAPDIDVRLTGFSGERGFKWKVFHIHDWTFEQTALRLMEKGGLIRNDVPREQDPYPAFFRHFPQLDRDDARSEMLLVLSEKLEKANKRIDKLISATAPLRLFYDGWRAVKWKSKKNRVLDKIRKEGLHG
ncbi:3-deoxy-manno-octulosonate cytidylyltransferase [Rhizobium sp. TRM95796]|uniref:3-deoxy-manno-octulosonate cytidylyltransferase n=1 Tax=Rhizobium sp. TRM95796 TaxID=2979862 RepID=UPI0021E83FA7|nr:3-deoxy-manno-octulosonate cytidylyltransferase [Rhizobium sp. TRM95796]MCV3764785.1 3-deoxy-manno-octulosonate cytidylyltransferase [Rhizobium sp. TRM95796]